MGVKEDVEFIDKSYTHKVSESRRKTTGRFPRISWSNFIKHAVGEMKKTSGGINQAETQGYQGIDAAGDQTIYEKLWEHISQRKELALIGLLIIFFDKGLKDPVNI